MKLPFRILLGAALLAALLAATGFVLTRTRRMSLFLEARDRIERGEARQEVLRDLAGEIDWEAEPPGSARRIAAGLAAGGSAPAPPVVFRAGAFALVRTPGGGHLLERVGGAWREIR